MPIEYALDVAFASDTKPNPTVGSSQPIAMAYGFTHGEVGQGDWSNDGQMKERLDANLGIHFSIFDTAGTPATLNSIAITFDNNQSPFSWSSRSYPSDEALPSSISGATSTGCNVSGTGWQVGPYPAVNEGHFECNVTVGVQLADGTLKTFSVDPEMIIRGG